MTLIVTSTAFKAGTSIPKKHTADGADVSPPLTWDNVPDGTKELALVVDDPDAPTAKPWVHWVLYKIPAGVRALPEGVPAAKGKLAEPAGTLQGKNSWPSENVGYRGPSPPSGVHHYRFHLYALDAPLEVAPELDKDALVKAMTGHVVAEGELVGTYRR